MILRKKTELGVLKNSSKVSYDDMLKIVIEIKRKLIAADAELHADLAIELYDDGSNEDDLFGANIYFEDNDIEWSSTINVKQNVRLAVRQGEE